MFEEDGTKICLDKYRNNYLGTSASKTNVLKLVSPRSSLLNFSSSACGFVLASDSYCESNNRRMGESLEKSVYFSKQKLQQQH